MFDQTKFIILVTALICVTLGDDWTSHKTKFSLKFSNTTEESDRKFTWAQNEDAINIHNQKAASDRSITFTMGVNEFTHLRYDEFIAQLTGYTKNKGMSNGACIFSHSTSLDHKETKVLNTIGRTSRRGWTTRTSLLEIIMA